MSLFRKLAFCSKPPKKRREAGRKGGRDEECAVCQDVPTDPCTVPCGNNHVFCLSCLQGLVRHNDYRRHFPCPLCRTRVKIPVRGLAVLKNEKDFRDKVLAKLPSLKPRCHRRSQSTSSSVSSNWLPNEVLEVVIPWDQLNEVPSLDASFIEALEDVPLGRLYLDTLTRRNRALEDSLDLNEEFPLDSVDVELQRRILEEIERAAYAPDTPAAQPPVAPNPNPNDSLDDDNFSHGYSDHDDAFASTIDHGTKKERKNANDEDEDEDDEKVEENWLVLRNRASECHPDSSRSESSLDPPTLRHCANTPRVAEGLYSSSPRDADTSRSDCSSLALPSLRHCANTPRPPLGGYASRAGRRDREEEEEETEEGEEEEEEEASTSVVVDLDMRVVMQLIADMDRDSDAEADPSRDTTTRDGASRDQKRDTKQGTKRDAARSRDATTSSRDATTSSRDATTSSRDATTTSRDATTRDTTIRQQSARSADPNPAPSTRPSGQPTQPGSSSSNNINSSSSSSNNNINSSSSSRSGQHEEQTRRALNARIRQHLDQGANTGTGRGTPAKRGGTSGSEGHEDWKHNHSGPVAHRIPRPKLSQEAATAGEGEEEEELTRDSRERTPDSRRPQLMLRSDGSPSDKRATAQRPHASSTHPDRENYISFDTRSPANSPYRRRRVPSDWEHTQDRREAGRAVTEDSRFAARRSSQDEHTAQPRRVARVKPVRRNHSDGNAKAEEQRRRCRSESARDVSANSGLRTEVAGDREYAENLRRVSSLLQPRSRLSRPDAPAAHAREMAAASAVPASASGSAVKDRKPAKNVTVITV